MKNLTLEHIALACGGTYVGAEDKKSVCAESITTDSRNADKGSLFVAIKGARVDGHDFIPKVAEQGALAALSERELPDCPIPYIRVESTLQAVKDIAEYYLEQLEIPVVGITGSVGKTSTKEMIAAVLAQKYNVLKTLGNFNNELGLPLTVFRLREEHEIAVLEMGINHFGEMHRLARIAKPDTCVITNIGYCHLENLIDRDGVLKAKTEMFDHMKPGGTAILNGDDDKLATVKEVHGKKAVYFGLNPENEIYADEIEPKGLKGISCRIHTAAGSFSVLIPIPGRHMVYNALAGTAVGLQYGLTLEQIKEGIESLQSLSGRFHIIEANGMTIVDDCYNANPMSMKASLDVLKDALGRKVAILGDMGELGENESALHAEVGEHAANAGIDCLICAGTLSKGLAEAAKKTNPSLLVMHYDTREELMGHLGALVKPGDTVLVKASHAMQFEKIVEALQKM